MEDKRKISILIPYKIERDNVLVYLQKRSKDAKRLPDYFGFFGGGAEDDENPEQALQREIKEEIGFVPEEYRHFKKYEFDQSIKDIFVIGVDDGFEDRVEILEGEYGRWFEENDALRETKLIEEDKIVLRDLYKSLRDRE